MAPTHAAAGLVKARPAPSESPHLEVSQLCRSFGTGAQERAILDGVTFAVPQGEYVSIVGPSGSGKTTVLRCIAGLIEPTGGEIQVDGRSVHGPPKSLAVVFQDYSRSLMPWLRTLSNVVLPLRGKGIDPVERRHRGEEALEAVGLSHIAAQYPWQLSGGMQQRVALARAIAYQPKVLLMDEPFASVDAQTRADLEDLVLQLRKQYDMTIISVTHDIDEAVYMSDRVIVLGGEPASVAHDVRVDLGDERDQITTKSAPRFAELRARILLEVRH